MFVFVVTKLQIFVGYRLQKMLFLFILNDNDFGRFTVSF